MQIFLRPMIAGMLYVGCLISHVGAQVVPTPPQDRDAAVIPFSLPQPGDQPLSVKPTPLRQAPLDAVVLFNPNGKRSILLPGGWPLEDLDEFYQFLLKDRQEPTSSFAIQGIVAQGQVVGNRVETSIRFVITTSNTLSVRIPLGMKEGVLPFLSKDPAGNEKEATKAPLPYRYSGPGTFDLHVDPVDGQYVALIRPGVQQEKKRDDSSPDVQNQPKETDSDESRPADDVLESPESVSVNSLMDPEPVVSNQRHELTLSLWFPVTKIGDDEQRLVISFPQSVSSQLMLTVPLENAIATVTQGSLLDESKTRNRQNTQFNILGLKPNFALSWRKRKAEPVEDRPVLYVEDASIIARLENKATIYDATFPVRSPSGGFDLFRIRLPQGAVLDQESTEKYASSGGYSYQVLSGEEPQDKPSNTGTANETAPIVEIRFAQKKFAQVKVRLKVTRPYPSEKPGDWRELGGFELLGAERQSGYLSVGIPNEMRPNWRPIRGIRRVDLPAALAQEGIDARFEFHTQPFTLGSQIVLPKTRINVKPEYQVAVNQGVLSLKARFSFVIHGSKTEKLAVRLSDWQWNGDIGPSSIVDVEGVDQDATGLLTIPLRVPSDGIFDIELKAHRTIPRNEGQKQRLILHLPEPDADWIEPAALVVVPADNVEVTPVDPDSSAGLEHPRSPDVETEEKQTSATPQTERTVGLTRRARRSLPLRIDIPLLQQDPLIYQVETTDAMFVADLFYHRQKISATIQTDVRLLDPDEQVTEVISYDVAYEPIDKLFLDFPKELSAPDRVRVYYGGKALELRDVVFPDEGGNEQRDRKRVSLPEATIGKFQLVVRYGMPPVPIERYMTTSFTLSFVRPSADIAVASQRVDLLVPPGIQVSRQDDGNAAWKLEEPTSSGGYGATRSTFGTAFVASQAQERISLLIEPADRDVLGTTVVERAWLQSWLSDGDSIRQDRAIYLVNSNRDSISLRLPSKVDRERIIVRRDQVPIPVRLSPQGELTVPLTVDQKDRNVRLEVWYRIREAYSGSVQMELPCFGEDSLVRCQYWQIILPPKRHILGVPYGWTPEYRWAWKSGFWGRIPSIRMDEIGLQSDPTDTMPISPEANEYLFSSLHPTSKTSFYIADRSVIVLFCSSLTLLIGLALIYFPRTRYAGSLFGLGLALVALSVYQPAPVLLALQASSVGVLLALVAFYVYRIIYREERWVIPNSGWGEGSQPSKVYSVIMDDESNPEPKEPS